MNPASTDMDCGSLTKFNIHTLISISREAQQQWESVLRQNQGWCQFLLLPNTPNMEYTLIKNACILGLTSKNLLSFKIINMDIDLPSH